MDPLAEKYPNMGGFVYCANNPVRFVDPTGMDWYQTVDGEGNVVKESKPVYFKGSDNQSGYQNIGSSTLSIDSNGKQQSYNANGTISSSVVLGGVDVIGSKGPQGGGDYDFGRTNNAFSLAGLGWGINELALYNKDFWLGKNLKYYSTSWKYGNPR